MNKILIFYSFGAFNTRAINYISPAFRYYSSVACGAMRGNRFRPQPFGIRFSMQQNESPGILDSGWCLRELPN